MPSTASLLVIASAALVLKLGTVHLLYTVQGSKLQPRDPELMKAMHDATMRITRETTLWRAWVGFNITHSVGLLLFGFVYGYLALVAPGLFFASWFLRGLGIVLLLGLAVVSRRYFFSRPFQFVVLATALYGAGLLAAAL